MFKLLFLLFSPLLLFSDIQYKGVCGSYSYDLNISSNKFYGAFCNGEFLRVYQVRNGTDRILSLYTDPTYNSFDLYASNGNVVKSFDYNEGDIVNIGSPSFHLLSGFAGLFLGFSFLYIVMRLV